MPGSNRIRLVLCSVCAPKPEQIVENGFRNSWHRLPAFCPECEAKVAQCVRLLVAGGVVLFPRTGMPED